MLRVGSSILLISAVALLLIAPAACKADGISENFNAVTPALNATNIGSAVSAWHRRLGTAWIWMAALGRPGRSARR
jgi:hypothetical protein